MEVLSEEESREVISRMKSPFTKYHDQRPGSPNSSQKVLLLDGPGQAYRLDQGHNIPQPQQDEILIRVLAIGLNPIDWKGPEYNFGLPSFPWINGRDFAGVVVKASRVSRRVHVGDVVLSPSTDYRDIRKAAFQEFVVSTEHNAARIPSSVSLETGAAIGVAFVAASLALGICLGVDFSAASVRGPNLLVQLRTIQPKEFPDDIRTECLDGIVASERAKVGDWIAVWGASTATGLVAIQLAKLAGLRTIAIADVAKHGEKLLDAGANLLVDRTDTDRAIQIVKGVTKDQLRFALDTVGPQTAEHLQSCLSSTSEYRAHLVGLTGLPKTKVENVVHHKVPIKAFHTFSGIGEALMIWAERLLLSDNISWPSVHLEHGGFSGINNALGNLRSGTISQRIVVPIEQTVAAV